jgi:hypothetical protein
MHRAGLFIEFRIPLGYIMRSRDGRRPLYEMQKARRVPADWRNGGRASEDPPRERKINRDGLHQKAEPEKITVHTTARCREGQGAESDITTRRQRRACFVCIARPGNRDPDDLNETRGAPASGVFRLFTQ